MESDSPVMSVAEAGRKTELTQQEVAEDPYISPRILQKWEKERRKPSGPANALIKIVFRHPEIIWEDLKLRG